MKKIYHFLYRVSENIRLGAFGSKIRVFFLKKCGARCGTNVFIGPRITIVHPENLSLGNNVSIRQDTYIDCTAKVTIGNDVSIAHSVSIISFNHTYNGPGPIRENVVSSAPINISENCWIGCRAIILQGVKLQTKTIVGAGAVVNRSSSGNCILGGVPAKVIKDIASNESK